MDFPDTTLPVDGLNYNQTTTTANPFTVVSMYRGVYEKQFFHTLQYAQDALSFSFSPIPNAGGKRVEFDGVGSTELEYRTKRIQMKEYDELSGSKRFVCPVNLYKTLAWSEDDSIYEGDFAGWINENLTALSNAAIRKQQQVLLGVVPDKNLGNNCIIAKYNTVFSDATAGCPYKNGGTGGIYGTGYSGLNGNTPCELNVHPYLAKTGQATALSQYADGSSYKLNAALTGVVPHNFVMSGTAAPSGITIEKLLYGRMALESRYAVDAGERLVCVVTPAQMMDLMQQEKFQNVLYGNFKVLENGQRGINEFNGIQFLVSPYVPIVNVGTEESPKYVRACALYKPGAVRMGIWDNKRFDTERIPGSVDGFSLTVKFALGAGRLREEDVVLIMCDEDLDF